MLFFTDPLRTPHPAVTAETLPRGAGVVYRAFGAPDALETGKALAKVCRRRGLALLIGADVRLAVKLGADGVHLPERLASAPGRIRVMRMRFVVTAAAHGFPAVRRAREAGVQAMVVSPVFPSQSPSAGKALGPMSLARLVRASGMPVIALGGVNSRTATGLGLTGVAGIAAVDVFRT